MRRYLFSFNFEKDTINTYIGKFLCEHDYFYHGETISADLFGTDTYYRIEVEHVVNNNRDVYYYPDKKLKRSKGMERVFPLKEKSIRVDYPHRRGKVTFANGDTVTTIICGHKDKILDYYLYKNHLFNTGSDSDNLQNAVKVEFIA